MVFYVLIAVVVILEGTGWLSVVVVGSGVLISGIVFVAGRLTVEIDEQHVRIWYGWGWPRRDIDRTAITRVEQVRGRWFWGWGIRLTPRGWLWNVWGLDAVELTFTDGKRFRIGTDRPSELVGALGTTPTL